MKIVKRIAFVLICCLAVVGAYSLLKPPAKLHVDEKDREALKEIGIEITDGQPTENGLSGVMGTVQGVPSVGSTSGSSVASSFMEGPSSAEAAPLYGSEASAFAEAPPFSPGPAPAFNPLDEAPAFAPAVPTAAYASNAAEAPLFTPAVNPNPAANPVYAPAPPFNPAPTQEAPPLAPPFTPTPAPAPQFPPAAAPTAIVPPDPACQSYVPQSNYQPYSTQPNFQQVYQAEASTAYRTTSLQTAPETAPPFSPPPTNIGPSPPPWEGPTSMIPSAPSATSMGSRGDFPVSGPEPYLASEPTVKQTEPLTDWVPSAIGNEVFVADEKAFTPPHSAQDRYIRRLPIVNEMPPAQVVPGAGQIATQVQPPQQPTLETGSGITVTATTNGPHQADISQQPANDHPAIYREEPIISFSQQQPLAQRVAPSPAKPAEVEVLPFTSVEPSPIAATPIPSQTPTGVTFGTPNVASEFRPSVEPPVASSAPAIQQAGAETRPEIRPSVERFVKAQNILAETGEPQRIHNAFIQLNRLYEHRELSEAERIFMTTYLDKMALQVIYSHNAHILEKPHVVKPGESIDQIARQYSVPAALLMKINGLTGSRPLEPGTPLKIVVGPFDAKLSTTRGEMTLILGGLYAGRFTVTLGDQVKNLRGEQHIISKTFSYGDRFMTLDNGTTLRETDQSGRGVLPNTVYFSEKDGQELFDILSENSIVSFED